MKNINKRRFIRLLVVVLILGCPNLTMAQTELGSVHRVGPSELGAYENDLAKLGHPELIVESGVKEIVGFLDDSGIRYLVRLNCINRKGGVAIVTLELKSIPPKGWTKLIGSDTKKAVDMLFTLTRNEIKLISIKKIGEVAERKIRERPRGEAPGVPKPGAKPTKDGADCLEYEPATVKLAGKVLREVCPGPPNYESVEKGDEKCVLWFLNLEKPVCVKGREDGSADVPVSNLRKVQLVLDSNQYKNYKMMVNKNVIATGQLFHSFTGHHYAEALLTVKTMAANNPPESHELPIPTPEGSGENIK